MKLIAFDSDNEQPKRIVCHDDVGDIAEIFCDGEIRFHRTMLTGSTNWHGINAVAENFQLFYENIELAGLQK
jgi:hypothetical protein